MSDLFKGITFPWQEVTPSDDAIIRKAVLPDRRLSGCELSYSGYTLTMTAGVMIVCGRQFRHAAAQNWAITGATSGYARLLLTIDITKASTEDAFEQITASIEYATAADGFPDLRQDDINNAGTIYQTSICVVALGPGGITGFTGQILPGDNVFYPGRPVSMGGYRVTGVGAPEADGDAVNLGYAKKVGNPHNLLDNSDFRNPVNQRGFTSGSVATNAYFIDRWKAWSPTQISGFSANGLQMTSGMIRQDLTSELTTVLVGKRITFAAKIDGTVCVCHATVSQPGVYTQLAVNAPLEMAVTSGGLLCCGIRTSSAITIEWAALYEGEYTAENLPEYQPKGYGAELSECQRYYYYLSDFIAYGYGASYGEFCYSLLLPTKMRIIPTVTYGKCTLKSGTDTVTLNRIDQLKTTVRVEFQFITLDAALTGKVMQARLKDVCISADL